MCNFTALFSTAGVAIGSEMSGGMENITVHDCDFSNTGTGLDIKYSAYRGGYVKDIHFRNIVMGNTNRGALTVQSHYGAKNPSCKSNNPMPCPVQRISFTNITSAPGTAVASAIDFEGLPTNTILDVTVDNVHLSGSQAVTCSLVKGTFTDCPACAACTGLVPGNQ